ncbi:MAG: valine--pyruvate transaminase, partial [Caldilineae bacterium]
GDSAFVAALATLFRDRFGWDIGPQNIALTNGSQTAFFFLFNLFAGPGPDGVERKILLPLAPEYIGYADVGIHGDIFVSRRPEIEHLPDRFFKYHVDFDALHLDETIGAICVSRPTNPTGNVLTQAEMERLSSLARQRNIPLIVDNAYGAPFPGVLYTEAMPHWEPHIILCMSLSKLGLPGARTGIVIANEEVIQAVTAMNAIISLAPGNLGASLTLDLVRTGQILEVATDLVRPHYWAKVQAALPRLHRALEGVDYHIHKPEGAFFLWLWFRDMPITCKELYERLKARGVLVVPGHYFFPGLAEEWPHRHECIRMSYASPPDAVARGIEIIGEEVRRAYRDA